jgi:hypothetical protein
MMSRVEIHTDYAVGTIIGPVQLIITSIWLRVFQLIPASTRMRVTLTMYRILGSLDHALD